MANPPPYANITGISRAVMKDNAQETIQNYDGVAVVQGQAQFDTTATGGITANGYVALDLRTAGYNANSLATTGAASIDRSVIALASQAVTTAGTVINITPPLPTGATYAASVTPLSVATTAYVSNKNTSNVRVTVAANCSVDITLHRT